MSGITLKFEDLTDLTGLKSSSLLKIEELDLSGNKIKYFEAGVFSKLKKLKSLNLSNNLLKIIPDDVACDLSNVKVLNVAENSLTNLEFLKNFTSLEELICHHNGLELSQKFIAAYFCLDLQKLDGKTVASYRQPTSEFKDKLKQLCEKICDEELPGLQLPSEETKREELMKLVKNKKPSISGLPFAIKEFMIKDVCDGFPLKSLPTPKQLKSPTKRSSTKSPCTSPLRNLNLSPEKQIRSPRKKAKQEAEIQTAEPIVKKVKEPDFVPLHFIRCHFGDKKALKEGHSLDDPTDELTNVWSCAFEPDLINEGKTTSIVATCGGCTVCLIDCGSGQVLKRYTQQQEQFFCLAWTTLKIGSSFSNVLAVSGHNGRLKILHPSQLICFAEHGNGRPNKSVANFYYSNLLFHPTEKTWLFCSSSDTTVTLFDIGIPSGPTYSTQIKQLTVFVTNPAGSVFNIVINKPNGWLIGGTNKGIMVWMVGKDGERSNKAISASRRKEPIKTLTVPHSSDSQTVDGLVSIDDDHFACKFVSHGSIYIFSIRQMNKGPLHVLKWHNTDVEFLGINYCNGILGCGDDEGSIWLYSVDALLGTEKSKSKHSTTPFKILKWPKCKIDTNDPNDAKMVDVLEKPEPLNINNLGFNTKGEYLVALNDCNLVCIWKSN